MLRSGSEVVHSEDSLAEARLAAEKPAGPDRGVVGGKVAAVSESTSGRRHTPRVSLIVVLPEHHIVSPDSLAERLRARDNEDFEVVVACAGQPTNLSALQRSVGEAQFLLAPGGTSTEDLRELAMRQAGGDIVTLLNGALLPSAGADSSLVMTS